MNYTKILFDLDGTITDSAEGIINSIIYALEKMNYLSPSTKKLHSFIGPPLKESFEKICHMSSVDANRAVEYYREYYKEKGMYENEVYEGISELLSVLTSLNCQLYIATSKPEVFAKNILTHFNLAHFFKGIYGASMDGSRSSKKDVITYALKEIGLVTEEKKEKTIMIGDRQHDIYGGKENNLDTIGVVYGFGDLNELQNAGATYIAKTPSEIKKILS